MKLFWLLQSTLQKQWTRILVIAGVGGVANALILGIINAGAFATANKAQSVRHLLLFVICLFAFYVAKRYAIAEGSQAAEKVLSGMLSRIVEKIRCSELPVVEQIIHRGNYQSIAHDTTMISQATLMLINAAQQSIVLVVCLIYIACISLLNFFITVIAILIAVGLYYLHTRKLIHEITAQKSAESAMLTTLEDVVDGFKEVRLNSARSEAIHSRLNDITAQLYQARVRTNMHYCTEMMFSDVFFYMLLAVIVFILPQYQQAMISEVLMSAAAILFIIGPLQSIVASSPIFLRAAVAIEHIEALESELDRAAQESGTIRPDLQPTFTPVATVCLRDILFMYPAKIDESGLPTDPFQVGPFSLEISRGQTVFLVGGNGCGKTTLLKVLTGLYLPTSGQVLVNGQPVTPDNLTSYRNHIAAIFSDFHLFDQLYGYEDVDPARVNALLRQMEISDKTAFQQGRFTTLKLSTGQRKRLAMITALLEARDILVFDEWAADQDPHFRAYFYEQLLPELKAQGKTIIAVTHDERYWSLADRVVRLEYGMLAEPVLS